LVRSEFFFRTTRIFFLEFNIRLYVKNSESWFVTFIHPVWKISSQRDFMFLVCISLISFCYNSSMANGSPSSSWRANIAHCSSYEITGQYMPLQKRRKSTSCNIFRICSVFMLYPLKANAIGHAFVTKYVLREQVKYWCFLSPILT
jgi:hypothetical protein